MSKVQLRPVTPMNLLLTYAPPFVFLDNYHGHIYYCAERKLYYVENQASLLYSNSTGQGLRNLRTLQYNGLLEESSMQLRAYLVLCLVNMELLY